MTNVYFRHKNSKNVILSFDDNYRPIAEVSAGQNKLRNKAFYVRFPSGFIGVYSSAQGPVLFVNEEKRLFSDHSWNLSVQKIGAVNGVCFTGLNQGLLSFEYPVVELEPLDPWSEEKFDDFFIWLSMKRADREFIEMWTE